MILINVVINLFAIHAKRVIIQIKNINLFNHLRVQLTEQNNCFKSLILLCLRILIRIKYDRSIVKERYVSTLQVNSKLSEQKKEKVVIYVKNSNMKRFIQSRLSNK